MNVLIESLVFVSSGLLIPCVALLFILLGQALNKALLSFRTHKKQLSQAHVVSRWIRESREPTAFPGSALCGDFGEYSNALLSAGSPALAAHLMAEFEAACERQLASLNRLARLGPITGLLGTLIPMGPALDGLANGDIAQLAGQMQVAFTTTVIGLLIGGIGFVLVQRQLQITRQQLAAMVNYLSIGDLLFSEEFTIVKNPSKKNMEIVAKKGAKIRRYQGESSASGQGKGKKVGTAYQLESGEIVYLPE